MYMDPASGGNLMIVRRHSAINRFSAKQSGFTLLEISLVMLVLASLVAMFHSNAFSSSDSRLAHAAVIEAKRIAQLAEECRTSIKKTTFVEDDGDGAVAYTHEYEEFASFADETASDMKDECGFNLELSDETPLQAGDKYEITITPTKSEVSFFVPITGFSEPNTEREDAINTYGISGTKVTVAGRNYISHSSAFAHRSLMDKKLFFGQKINRDDSDDI